MARQKTAWGTMIGTAAASADEVAGSYSMGHEFNVGELKMEIRLRGLPTRGALERHLYTLRDRGFIEKTSTPGGWRRIR